MDSRLSPEAPAGFSLLDLFQRDLKIYESYVSRSFPRLQKDDILDILQNVALVLHRKDNRVCDETDNPKAWLQTKVRSACIDYIRHEKFQLSTYPGDFASDDFIKPIADNSILAPDEAFFVRELQKGVQTAMGLIRVQEESKQVFTMFALEGKKHKEIAEELDLPIGTVTGRVKAVRDTLYNYLRKFS